MSSAGVHSVLRWVSLSWLTGPVLGKELRSASRRKRQYLLRFGYVALLGLFMAVVWMTTVEASATGAGAIYRMSQAGKTVIMTISWFQFFALQLVAVVLMSTSINEEAQRGTLAVLLTTPISATQIVTGKLLGKMLHIVILLAISLPLLAIVRVFGGVPLAFVIASSCVTLSTAMLAGAVAMFFSGIFQRAYASILLSFAAGFVIYLIVPFILSMVLALLAMAGGGGSMLSALLYLNPFYAMGFLTVELLEPSAALSGMYYWPLGCLVTLGLCAIVLLLCVRLVRGSARRRALGDTGSPRWIGVARPIAPPPLPRRLPATPGAPGGPPERLLRRPPASGVLRAERPDAPWTAPAAPAAQPAPAPPQPRPPVRVPPVKRGRSAPSKLRRITGSPLVWRKLRTPMFPGRALRVVAVVVPLVLAGVLYVLLGLLGALDEPGAHGFFASLYVLVGIAATGTFAATGISSERESRTLPILLTTPVSDWHIVGAMAVGVLRRSLPAWLLLAVHMLLFTIAGVIHPAALPQVALLVAWVTVFLTGSGLFFSSRCRKTTTAVVFNLCLALGLWAVLPTVASIAEDAASGLATAVAAVNPVAQATVVVEGSRGWTAHGGPKLAYEWASERCGLGRSLGLMALSFVGYSAAGVVLLWAAKGQLRKSLD
jgi:ABC-type transport system involved in multi-copper enzyme maturation permease subunit